MNERLFELVSGQFKASFKEKIEKAKNGYPFSKIALKNSLDTAKRSKYINETEYTFFNNEIIQL